MVAVGNWYRGYPEIALRMLLKVVTNDRIFRRFTHKMDDSELVKPDKKLRARDRLEIRLGVLRNNLFFARSKKEKQLIMEKIYYINHRLKKIEYDASVRKRPDYRERHKKYMIEYRKRKKELAGE